MLLFINLKYFLMEYQYVHSSEDLMILLFYIKYNLEII